MKFLYNIFFLVVIVLMISSCKDDPIVDPPVELITTVTYTLVAADGTPGPILNFQDLDGDGGTAPTITGGTLMSNTTYTGSLEFLNESENPAEDITEEIKTEDAEHQVFFQASGGLDASVTYNDQDGDGNPLGLQTTLTTGAAGSGTLTITLRHEPNKSASGVAGGDITNAGGETDIEVTFDIDVQ